MITFTFTESSFNDADFKRLFFTHIAPKFYRMKFSCCMLVKRHIYGYGLRELQDKLSISQSDLAAFQACKEVPNPSQLLRLLKWMNLEARLFFPPSSEAMAEFPLEKL